MRDRNIICPVCGYECEKYVTADMICPNTNCRLYGEPISPCIWNQLHDLADFISILARENNDLEKRLKFLMERQSLNMNSETSERVFKLNAFMREIRAKADDMATIDMIPIKMVDDAESAFNRGMEDAFMILFRVQEIVTRIEIKVRKNNG